MLSRCHLQHNCKQWNKTQTNISRKHSEDHIQYNTSLTPSITQNAIFAASCTDASSCLTKAPAPPIQQLKKNKIMIHNIKNIFYIFQFFQSRQSKQQQGQETPLREFRVAPSARLRQLSMSLLPVTPTRGHMDVVLLLQLVVTSTKLPIWPRFPLHYFERRVCVLGQHDPFGLERELPAGRNYAAQCKLKSCAVPPRRRRRRRKRGEKKNCRRSTKTL